MNTWKELKKKKKKKAVILTVAEKQTFLYKSAQYNHIMAKDISFSFFCFMHH